MLKVLVVDDEPIVREGIKTIIDWENYGFTVYGDAANGIEGLHQVRELQPDLVMVDIKMPGMDGLQMIEEMRREKLNARIILLTGYSQFEYARKALQLGVKSYLLKPIEEDELIMEITKIYDEIVREKKEKDYIHQSVLLSREKILESIVYGYVGLEGAREFSSFYAFNFPWSTYRVVLLQHRENENPGKTAIRQIKDILKKHMESAKDGYVFEMERYLAILQKNADARDYSPVFENVIKELDEAVGGSNILTVGNPVSQFEDIVLSFQNALQLMDKKFFFEDKKIISEALVKQYIHAEPEVYIGSIIASLLNNIQIHDDKKILDDINSVKSKLLDYDISPEGMKACYLSIFISVVNNLNMKYENSEDMISDQKTVYKNIQRMSDMHQVENYVKSQLILLSGRLLDKKSIHVINNVLTHIHKNLEKDMKLETLSRVFNYNSAYLGKLFKDHTGEYFNTYLDRVRMEKAKRLLMEGCKVYEAAEKVGFSNMNYFYSKFKKYTGMPPRAIKSMDSPL